MKEGSFSGALAASQDAGREPPEDGGEAAGAVATTSPRLHHLDWIRLLMVICVVFAHTSQSGLREGGGFEETWLIDDRTLYNSESYRKARCKASASVVSPSPYSVRYVAVVRQFCLPLLFWVSGASIACSYRGGLPVRYGRLIVYLCTGLLLNAALWYSGPQEGRCRLECPGGDTCLPVESCIGRGLFFDFTIAGLGGQVFAILFQMWYVLALVVMATWSCPTFAVLHGSWRPWWLGPQALANVGAYAIFVLRGTVPHASSVLASLAVLEVAFSALLGAHAAQLLGSGPGPLRWCPERLVHYALALVSLAQFGLVPYGSEMHSLNMAYVAFLVIGFNRFFGLGFVMTSARRSPRGDKVSPILSRFWPVVLVMSCLVAPSTNWDLAGLLSFPYFKHAFDRCTYIGGALILVFFVDRITRHIGCDPVPGVLGIAGLLLYLLHPWLITVLLQIGLRSLLSVWLLSMGIAGLLAVGWTTSTGACADEQRHPAASPSGGPVE